MHSGKKKDADPPPQKKKRHRCTGGGVEIKNGVVSSISSTAGGGAGGGGAGGGRGGRGEAGADYCRGVNPCTAANNIPHQFQVVPQIMGTALKGLDEVRHFRLEARVQIRFPSAIRSALAFSFFVAKGVTENENGRKAKGSENN